MEEVLLLCLRNSGNVSGSIFGFSEISTGNGLAGAATMELSLRGRLSIVLQCRVMTSLERKGRSIHCG